MTQSRNNYPYSYKDECISYNSLFPYFNKKDFNKLDEIYNKLDIDNEIKKITSSFTEVPLSTLTAAKKAFHPNLEENVQNAINNERNLYKVLTTK